mgnify:CR=1 FL=1
MTGVQTCALPIYQHGDALGVTVSSSDDNALPSERDLRAMLAALMGGRAAEALLFTEVTGGAANDFEQARDGVGFDFVTRDDAPTTCKSRFVDISGSLKKLFEVYFMNDAPLASAPQQQLDGMIAERIKDYDVVIVTDFGHGMLHGSTVKLLSARAPFLALNTQTNSGNHGYNLISKYTRADYICLDGPEARLADRRKPVVSSGYP